jgi:LysR family nitrogen assimilation transcriptional regulator
MDIKQLEYFVRVAENGSFSRAALALDVAQSALSRQVRALEVELRETLLIRNGRGVALTEAGVRLHAHAVIVLQQMQAARDELGAIKGEPVGHIAIGLPPSMARALTVPLVERFKAELPQAKLSLVEGFTSHMVEWLLAGRIDLAMLYNPDPHPDLQFLPLFSEGLALIGPPQHPRFTGGSLSQPVLHFSDLTGLPLILPERSQVIRRLLERHAALQGGTLDVALEVSSIPAIVDLVAHGHGFAVLPRSTVQHSAQPDRMAVKPMDDAMPQVVLSLALPLHRRATPLTHAASTILKDLMLSLHR